ncbi:MAG: ABC transporter ATP-binding protein [Candidatus Methanomethylicia archaeon]
MVRVKLDGVNKRFGNVVAAENVCLDILESEFFTILGPSGCGKTTLLRIIAGLEKMDSGRIFFDDVDVTNLPPYLRHTGMVFQNYALWPHMTVFDNVAFGLKIRKISKDEINRRVKEALELVKLSGLENRYPHQLSGGQQQRVALARALVIEPRVLLLDEPLSNLDAKLRIEMRSELKSLQKRLKITTIYVTHDQDEALTLSDRIAIMNSGRILQIGSPIEIYNKPRNLYVASFIGKCTLLNGEVKDVEDGYLAVKCDDMMLWGVPVSDEFTIKIGSKVACILRPEHFKIHVSEKDNVFVGYIKHISFLGSHNEVRVKVNGNEILAIFDSDFNIDVNKPIKIAIPRDRVMILPYDNAF